MAVSNAIGVHVSEYSVSPARILKALAMSPRSASAGSTPSAPTGATP
jgi:hypothetical protein